MEQEKESILNSWDKFISGNFLKAINVLSENESYNIMSISEGSDPDGNEIRLRLHLERLKNEYDFDVNKTNAVKLKELGAESPMSLIDKKIYFRKVLVRNPKTNKEVESLRILKLE